MLSGLQPWPASVVYPCHSYYSLLTVVGLLPFFLGASSFALGRPEGGLLPVAFGGPGGGPGWGGIGFLVPSKDLARVTPSVVVFLVLKLVPGHVFFSNFV